MKIYIIDNGGQWTHREWRVVRSLGVDSEILPNDTPSYKLSDADGIVLSGGAPSIVSELNKLGYVKEYLAEHDFPVLGICVGAQFIALNSGGEVGPGTHPEYGKTAVRFFNKGAIFSQLPDQLIAWENHNDEIKSMNDDYVVCASSEGCKVQAFYHKTKPIFGVQFHPEVNNTEHGEDIFRSFMSVCAIKN
ncbi:GMP synthase [glutamine-hydrolyzing] subunit A [Thermoplasmatales archaeon]|nr:GMP synthase [glutamine-hydrolyzing] subunit A [Thermoplasmatales archaeon]